MNVNTWRIYAFGVCPAISEGFNLDAQKELTLRFSGFTCAWPRRSSIYCAALLAWRGRSAVESNSSSRWCSYTHRFSYGAKLRRPHAATDRAKRAAVEAVRVLQENVCRNAKTAAGVGSR